MEPFQPIVTAAAFRNAFFEGEDIEGNFMRLLNLRQIRLDFKALTNDDFHKKFIAICHKNKITYRGFTFKNERNERRYKIVVYKDGYDSHHKEYTDPKQNVSNELMDILQTLLDVQLGNANVIKQTKRNLL